jgi:hypothetical protein
MFVYIDESGDSGMGGKAGSSPNFVLAAVIFEDEAAARQCRQTIRALKRDLDWPPRHEFKFNKMSRELRERFLTTVASEKFRYIAFVLDKAAARDTRFTKTELYTMPVKLLLTHAREYLSEATVVLDKSGDRDFRRSLQLMLRSEINTPQNRHLRHIRTEKSHACELIQLADMVAGAVARSCRDDRHDRDAYRRLLMRREVAVIEWP